MTLTEQEKKTATRAGTVAGRAGLPMTDCPYRGEEPRARALRYLWVAAYQRVKPAEPGTVNYDES
ncbi:Rmf/CrpP family protein [Actinomadura yumaensis]|uniref:Rmf/CrpP family protein n=1 Tax=Actinomadura yumaensis TaxID=111807 RepID=A0ABW2CQZ1_9ACTN